eukprot:4484972-Pyramimonas_sp.AAC.1
MSSPCRARCVGDVHGDVSMRVVGRQELVDAPLGVPSVEAVLRGQAVQVVLATWCRRSRSSSKS